MKPNFSNNPCLAYLEQKYQLKEHGYYVLNLTAKSNNSVAPLYCCDPQVYE